MRPLIAIVAIAVALAGGACGDSEGDEAAKTPAADTAGAEAPGGGSTEIAIKDFSFAPARLETTAGTAVEVRNQDDAAHTVTATDKSLDTGTVDAGGSKTITASKPGTFSYICSIHEYMTGEIVVR